MAKKIKCGCGEDISVSDDFVQEPSTPHIQRVKLCPKCLRDFIGTFLPPQHGEVKHAT